MFQKEGKSLLPLQDNLRHVADPSLEEAIHRRSDEPIAEPVIVAAAMIALALYEWGRVAFSLPPQPIAATIAAVLASAWAVVKSVRAPKNMRQARHGREGER